MKSLLALTWRCLLVAGLVFNPVAGMGIGAALAAPTAAATAKAPPCHHDMATQQQPAPRDATAPCHDGGKDCGHFSCKYGACCLAGALGLPAPAFLATHVGSVAAHSRELSVALPPPPSRMIRPPIA